jgi:hybrid cluster-associated redox disulfide protein
MCGHKKWHFSCHFLQTVSPGRKRADVAAPSETLRTVDLFAPAQSPETAQLVLWRSLEMLEVKRPLTIDPEMTVDEIMRRWPATIRVFIRNRMLCIGCPIGVFHTVKDACDAHRIDEDIFSGELLAAMTKDDLASGPSLFETTGAM